MRVAGGHDQAQEALVLFEMLSLTHEAVEEGRIIPVQTAFAGIRERVKKQATDPPLGR